jgi:hypothetical protein
VTKKRERRAQQKEGEGKPLTKKRREKEWKLVK